MARVVTATQNNSNRAPSIHGSYRGCGGALTAYSLEGWEVQPTKRGFARERGRKERSHSISAAKAQGGERRREE